MSTPSTHTPAQPPVPASSPKAQQANAYLRTRVMTASPEELRLLLLEGAVRFARQGREGIAGKNFELSFTGLSSARDIVVELMTTIKPEHNPQLAEQVKSLYAFIYQQLLEGGHEKDVAKLDVAIDLLEFEVETWKLCMQKLAQERGAAPTSSSPMPAQTGGPASRPALSVQG